MTYKKIVYLFLTIFIAYAHHGYAQQIFALTLNRAENIIRWPGSDGIETSMAEFTIASLTFLKTECRCHAINDSINFLNTQSYYHDLFLRRYYDKVLSRKKRHTKKQFRLAQNKFFAATRAFPLFEKSYTNTDKLIPNPLFAFSLNTDWEKAYKEVR